MLPSGLRGHAPHQQSGFTLIELMVALVIGLIIILGAGQLFLMGFQTFRQTELLGNKQAALTFATETLIRDIRRANVDPVSGPEISFSDADGELRIEFSNNGDTGECSDGDMVVRVYRLSSDAVSASEGRSLDMGQKCGTDPTGSDFEPLVTGFADGGFGRDASETDESNGIWVITFALLKSRDDATDTDDFAFRAVNRNAAID
ncbi:prepilin-type N-terminal cleavage/methylation domain-containing protein [Billgrantia sulfidoxydans]|uniref:Prepilin-type N-terminal cleavage/methylation domain-containing protein n=1 Tax=Billgrantia sulfidoxydans TaxID=2733484 RepID=A0ABX7WA20_9GAMM|nr:prepilin-type N-terminal cleavage/methylation domain-containing protein [Halomonas sulfidoxydans]QTP56412.1 prepilin-type N-terminal cleavage/methylation domain-containing protein [Halomonas sulfidoxydans]